MITTMTRRKPEKSAKTTYRKIAIQIPDASARQRLRVVVLRADYISKKAALTLRDVLLYDWFSDVGLIMCEEHTEEFLVDLRASGLKHTVSELPAEKLSEVDVHVCDH